MEDVKVIDHRMHEEPETAITGPDSLNAVVLMAMRKGYQPEFIEKMLELQMKFEANEARKAFHKAMAAFKANPPKIWRDLQIKYQQTGRPVTEWSSADLGVASDAISKALGEHGLNYTWEPEPQETGNIKITCILSHELGHQTRTPLIAPPDNSGGKNSIQALGSTIFYLERYTLFAATGLAPAHMDNDGMGFQPIAYLAPDQITEINDKIKELKIDLPKFLAYLSKALKHDIDSVEKIPAKGYKMAMASIKAKEGKTNAD